MYGPKKLASQFKESEIESASQVIIKTMSQITDYMTLETMDALRVVIKKGSLLKTFGLLCCTISDNEKRKQWVEV
jgi:hypothetical protein